MTDHDTNLPKRKPTHLRHFDYSEHRRYFITICADVRKRLFSDIVVGEGLAPPAVHLSPIGKEIEKQLISLHQRYPMIRIDKYVIMPNHIHFILISEGEGIDEKPLPTTHDMICTLKSLVTRECRKKGFQNKIWQRSYYEHIIRDDEDYRNVWMYIDGNPVGWVKDEYF